MSEKNDNGDRTKKKQQFVGGLDAGEKLPNYFCIWVAASNEKEHATQQIAKTKTYIK